MKTVIGVRFKHAGTIYYFSPGSWECHVGDQVVVETQHSIEMGNVVIDKKEVLEEDLIHPLKEINSIATEKISKRKSKIKSMQLRLTILRQKNNSSSVGNETD